MSIHPFGGIPAVCGYVALDRKWDDVSGATTAHRYSWHDPVVLVGPPSCRQVSTVSAKSDVQQGWPNCALEHCWKHLPAHEPATHTPSHSTPDTHPQAGIG